MSIWLVRKQWEWPRWNIAEDKRGVFKGLMKIKSKHTHTHTIRKGQGNLIDWPNNVEVTRVTGKLCLSFLPIFSFFLIFPLFYLLRENEHAVKEKNKWSSWCKAKKIIKEIETPNIQPAVSPAWISRLHQPQQVKVPLKNHF